MCFNSSGYDFSVFQQVGPVMDMESIPEPVWREAEKRAAAR